MIKRCLPGASLISLIGVLLLAFAAPAWCELTGTAINATKNATQTKRKKIAVVEFDALNDEAKKSQMGRMTAELMITAAVNSHIFDVVEREIIQKILNEMEFGARGATYASVAQKIGELAGADAVLSGAVSELKDQMRIDARLVNVVDGRILAAKGEFARTDLKSLNSAAEAIMREMTQVLAPEGSVKVEALAGKGRLNVNVTPEDAKIRVKNVGDYKQDMELKPGKYTLEISKAGFASRNQIVTIEAGKEHTVEVELVKAAPKAQSRSREDAPPRRERSSEPRIPDQVRRFIPPGFQPPGAGRQLRKDERGNFYWQ